MGAQSLGAQSLGVSTISVDTLTASRPASPSGPGSLLGPGSSPRGSRSLSPSQSLSQSPGGAALRATGGIGAIGASADENDTPQKGDAGIVRRGGRNRFDDRSQLALPLSELNGEKPSLSLSLCVKMLVNCRSSKWMKGVALWMEAESRARVGRFVLRIQCMVRRRQARRRRKERERELAELAAGLAYRRAVIFAQSIMRRFLFRRRVSRLAQKV